MAARMTGPDRRSQVLGIAAGEFANHGLHGASIEAIAHEAGITQAYVFRMFGTKKALFLELVGAAFDHFSDGMSQAAKGATGRVARMWDTVADTPGVDPVTVKSFLAFGMLLNNVTALDAGKLDEPWATGVRTRIRAGLFEHITADTNR